MAWHAKRQIGKRLSDMRSHQRMTLKQLSKRSGLGITALNHVELGKGAMDWWVLARVSKSLGLPLADMLRAE